MKANGKPKICWKCGWEISMIGAVIQIKSDERKYWNIVHFLVYL